MSTSKLLARASAVALFISFLTACGGGGGGGGGSSTGGGSGDNLAVVDRGNAKQFAASYARVLNLGSEAVYYSPQLISQLVGLAQSTGSKSFDETFDCASGKVKISGSLDAGGIGTLTLNYQNCTEQDYYYGFSYRYTGVIRITTRGFSGGYPIAFDYRYDNYHVENLLAGTNDSYAGDFSVDPDVDGQRFVASLTITEGGKQQTTKAVNFSAVYGNGMPVRAGGRIERSNLGTIAVSGDNVHTYLSGRQGRLRIDSGSFYPLHLALDNDSNNTYESFAWVPWDLLDVQPTTNTAPIVTVSNPGLQPQTNETITVPINGVSDAEFDLLSYSVQVVQSPGNTNIQLALQEDQSFSFRTGTHGDYVIALTVDDGRGGVTTQNIAFRVSLPAPIVPTVLGGQFANGSLLTANLQPSNADAGPFAYQILSGPAGMTIDGQGYLQWQTTGTFFDRTEMQAAIKVSNADHDIVVPLQFTVTDSNRKPIVRTGANWGPWIEKNAFILDFKNDGTSRTLLTDNKNLIHTLNYQSGSYVEDWAFPYALTGSESIDHILPIDIDNDGDYEIAVQVGGKIFVINETHDGVARSVDLETGGGYGLASADIDNDGHSELIVLVDDNSNGYTQRGIVLDAATLAEKWRTPAVALGRDLAVGNVDNDPALELVFANGYVYDGISQANQWAFSSEFGGKVFVGDIDGNGVDEIVAVTNNLYSSYPTAYSAVSKSILWSINDVTNTCGLGLVQLDGDSALEVLTSTCYSPALRAFDATSFGTTLKWSTPQTQSTTNFLIGDIDNSGGEELVQLGNAGYANVQSFPVVMDAGTQAVLFNGSGGLSGGFSGGIPAIQSGIRQILFASQGSSASQTGVAFLALDPATEALVGSPLIDSTSSRPIEFCATDHDGDGSDDVLFAATESYWTNFVESYDLLTQTQQWKKTASNFNSYEQLFTCGDFNNDGHLDAVSYLSGDSTLSIDDPVNQTLLWSATLPNILQLAAGDTNGDGKQELYAINNSQLRKYSSSGSSYVYDGLFDIPAQWFFTPSPAVSLTDIDGDQIPEIIIAVQSNSWIYNEPLKTTLIVLNSDLSERHRADYSGLITVIAPEYIGAGKILAAVAESSEFFGSALINFRTAAIDVTSGQWIWRSPLLLGKVMPNSLHYDASASNGGSISIGTQAGMYITR